MRLPALTLRPGSYAVVVRVRSSAGASLIVWQGSVSMARPSGPTSPSNVTLPPVQALASTAQRTPLLWIIGSVVALLLVVGLGVGVGLTVGRRMARDRSAAGRV